MEHPNHRKNLTALRTLKEGGVKIASLDKMPQLDPHNGVFWRAWEALNSRRIINQHGPQPIQVSEVLAYADLMAVEDQEDREDLLHHISRLDPIFLTHEYERKARERRKQELRDRRASRRR